MVATRVQPGAGPGRVQPDSLARHYRRLVVRSAERRDVWLQQRDDPEQRLCTTFEYL